MNSPPLSVLAPPLSVLAWAASAVGRRTSVTRVQSLRASAGPWLLHLDGGAETRVVLKTGPNSHYQELAP